MCNIYRHASHEAQLCLELKLDCQHHNDERQDAARLFMLSVQQVFVGSSIVYSN